MNFTDIDIQKTSTCKSGKSLKIVNDMKKPLELQTGVLYSPFGVSKFENKWSGLYDYSVSCYVDEKFEKFITELGEHVAKTGNLTVVPGMKVNGDYPKLFKLKLPRDSNGNFNFVVFDNDKQKIRVTEDNVEEIFCKKRTFKCIIQCEKVNEWKEEWYIHWIITQMRYAAPTAVPEQPKQENYEKCLID